MTPASLFTINTHADITLFYTDNECSRKKGSFMQTSKRKCLLSSNTLDLANINILKTILNCCTFLRKVFGSNDATVSSHGGVCAKNVLPM